MYKDPRQRQPKLPIMYKGEVWSLGWEIQLTWAVDADGNVFESNGHGSEAVYPTTYEALLADRQKQLDDVNKDIRAIKAIQRKATERLSHGKSK